MTDAPRAFPRYAGGMAIGAAVRVLVVEPDPRTADLVQRALPQACRVALLTSATAAEAALVRERFDLVICSSRAAAPKDLGDAAFVAVDRTTALDERALRDLLGPVVDERRGASADPVIVGSSPSFMAVLETVDRVALSNAPVLLVGETGTGKELLAGRIHGRGPRRHRPLVIASAEGLATETADGGTLFVDEIADLPLAAQSALLRLLEGRAGPDVDARVIATTQRPLSQAVREGRLREDLYYRLHSAAIIVPPLRDRRDDIPALASWFFSRARIRDPQATAAGLGDEAVAALVRADWPGNVRQLASVIERAVVFATTREITVADLALTREDSTPPPPYTWPEGEPCSLQALTARYVDWVLAQTDGDKARAAAILDVDVSTLYRWQRRQSADR